MYLYLSISTYRYIKAVRHIYVCIHLTAFFPITDGHLGCVHIFVIADNAAVNIGEGPMYSFLLVFWVSSYIYIYIYCPDVELLGQKVILFLIFFENPPYCFPQWLHQSAFPPTVY